MEWLFHEPSKGGDFFELLEDQVGDFRKKKADGKADDDIAGVVDPLDDPDEDQGDQEGPVFEAVDAEEKA